MRHCDASDTGGKRQFSTRFWLVRITSNNRSSDD